MQNEVMTAADLIPFLRAHYCFRRDLLRTRMVLTSQPTMAPARASALARYWMNVMALLEHHHETEDDSILPVLLDRVPSAAGPVAELEREHVELQRLLNESAPLFADFGAGRGGLAAAVECVREMERIVGAHLDAEERAVVPLFADCFSRAEWSALEQRTTDALARDGLLPFALPWAAEGLEPAIMQGALALLPAPTQVAFHDEWQPRYTEQVRLVWGGTQPVERRREGR